MMPNDNGGGGGGGKRSVQARDRQNPRIQIRAKLSRQTHCQLLPFGECAAVDEESWVMAAPSVIVVRHHRRRRHANVSIAWYDASG